MAWRHSAARCVGRLAFALAAGSMVGNPARAEAVKYTIDPTHTFPMFEVSHLGFSKHRGRFNSTHGTLLLDREAKRGEIEITIDAASIDTGHEALEKVLRSDGFFNVEQFPVLRFRSRNFTFGEAGLISIDGELSLLGVTRPVSLQLYHFYCGPRLFPPANICGANAIGKLIRSEFGMDKYTRLGVGDEVTLNIQVEAIADPVAPPPTN